MPTKIERTDFEAWWSQYPLKRGKIAAEKAYWKVRRRGASSQDLIAAIGFYMRWKPDWQHYAHPATWLNQGRHLDSYDTPAPAQQPAKRVPEAYRPYVRLGDRPGYGD